MFVVLFQFTFHFILVVMIKFNTNNTDIKQRIFENPIVVLYTIEPNNFGCKILCSSKPTFCGRAQKNLERFGNPNHHVVVVVPFLALLL